MDIQTIIVYLIFFVCVVCAVKWLIARINKKKGSGCNCGCDSGCGCGCSGCGISPKDTKESSCSSQSDKTKIPC